MLQRHVIWLRSTCGRVALVSLLLAMAAACPGQGGTPGEDGVEVTLTVADHCLEIGQATSITWATSRASGCRLNGVAVPTSGTIPSSTMGANRVQDIVNLVCWSGAEPASCDERPSCAADGFLSQRCAGQSCVVNTLWLYNAQTIDDASAAALACWPAGDKCARHTTCAQCRSSGSCGWCESARTCQTGTASGPSAGTCGNWLWSDCFNGQCGGAGGGGDTCPRAACCSLRVSTVCCAPPFCGGNCVGSPCCP